SLLEVMIALIVAALATTALLRAAGVSLRATTDAALYQQAIVRAKAHLDAATHGGPLHPGDWQGDDGGGFHWQLRVTPAQVGAVRPFGTVGPRAQTALKVVLYQVVTAISWRQDGQTRMVTLQTERIGGG
ncbi:MAG TPA: hypothetical protein VHO91_02950, partial [Rhodopila sp.]|nr:hypothetical protein [Rhodopila sp.]